MMESSFAHTCEVGHKTKTNYND